MNSTRLARDSTASSDFATAATSRSTHGLKSMARCASSKGHSLTCSLTKDCASSMRHRQRPFLLSIHFRAPHTPYGPVPEARFSALPHARPDDP